MGLFRESPALLATGQIPYDRPPAVTVESSLAGASMLERRGSSLESGVFAQRVKKDDIPSVQHEQYATLTVEIATPQGMQTVEQLIINATGDKGIVETVTQPVVASA